MVGKLLALFSADELKSLCKEQGLKSYSKYKKAELVNFVSTQMTEEQVPSFIDGSGKKKLQEIIDNAMALLGGASVAGERLEQIDVTDERVTASYKGLKWQTEFSARLSSIKEPSFDFSCDCKVAEAGGMCIHFWAAIVELTRQGKIDNAALGSFDALVGPAVNAGMRNIGERKQEESIPEKDTAGKTIAELLQDKTQGNRYSNALVELGMQEPSPVEKKTSRSRKGKKSSGEESAQEVGPSVKPSFSKESDAHRVKLVFSEQVSGVPARFVVGWNKLEGEDTRESSLRVLIDEEKGVIAHEGCMDFTMRMAKQKLLCKHVIQVLVSIDEQVARRILAKLNMFRFSSELPAVKAAKRELGKDVLETKPTVTMADRESLKSAILDYLLAHEADEDALSIEAIQVNFSSDVNEILPVLVAEGMIVENKPGRYKIK